jgi:hypothetical protein
MKQPMIPHIRKESANIIHGTSWCLHGGGRLLKYCEREYVEKNDMEMIKIGKDWIKIGKDCKKKATEELESDDQEEDDTKDDTRTDQENKPEGETDEDPQVEGDEKYWVSVRARDIFRPQEDEYVLDCLR